MDPHLKASSRAFTVTRAYLFLHKNLAGRFEKPISIAPRVGRVIFGLWSRKSSKCYFDHPDLHSLTIELKAPAQTSKKSWVMTVNLCFWPMSFPIPLSGQ